MAEIVIQDPLSDEVQSPLIAGITEALNKISAGLEMGTESLEAVRLDPVGGQNPDDPRRIYQVENGKRLWLKSPAPKVYLNGGLVTSAEKDFSMDYIGGSIAFVGEYRPEEEDTLTVSFTHIKSLDNVIEKIRTVQTATDAAQESANNANLNAESAKSTANKNTPVGTVMYFAKAEPPEGYLACNGATVSRSTYSALFSAIGTTYGSGDGSTTFALPDLRDRVAWGGTAVGTVKAAGLPNITGTSLGNSYTGSSFDKYATGAFATLNDVSLLTLPSVGEGADNITKVDFKASRSNSIYGASSTVQPPALTLLPCIKY